MCLRIPVKGHQTEFGRNFNSPHYDSQLALVGVGSRWFALVWRWSWARRWAPTPIWQQALKHLRMLIHEQINTLDTFLALLHPAKFHSFHDIAFKDPKT